MSSQNKPTEPLTGGGIIGWFAANSVAANLLLITVIILGVLSFSKLRQEGFPSLEPNTIRISVIYDGGTPSMAEEGIALKIEEALEALPGIQRMTSTSNKNGSSVSVEKESNYDLDVLFTDIKTEIDAINNFPSEAEKPVITKARRQDHAIWVQLYGDAESATMQALAERIKVDLLAKDAISDLTISGKEDILLSVEVEEVTLQAYGLTMTDIANAINAESSSPLSTSLRNDQKVMRLSVANQAYSVADFAKIPLLTTADGAVIRLGHLASIKNTFDDDSAVLTRYNQQNSLGIQVLMDEYGDVSRIVEQAQQVADEWQASGLLPANVHLETWYDKSLLIKERLSLLTSNAMSGIAMVFFILALFLNIRVAFWVAAGLPFIFFGTLFFMTDSFTGLTLNQMTTFGFIMALGIVVDDAVVIGESVYETRRRHGDTLANTVRGTTKVAIPTLFGVLTTVATFTALSNIEGRMGQIYAQFGTVVTICLLLSVVESKLILPAHLAHLNTRRKTGTGWRFIWINIQAKADNALQGFNQYIYRPLVKKALAFRYAVVLGFVAVMILVMGMPMTGAVRISFFPNIPGDVVSARINMQKDASFGQTHQNLLQLEAMALQTDRELSQGADSNIKSLLLSSSDDLSGSITIQLDTDGTYTAPEFVRRWKVLSGSPEGVRQLSIRSSREMVDNLNVELKAWDDDSVVAAGLAFKAALKQMPGVSGIDDNLSPGEPQLRFELTEQGRALGMDTAALSKQIFQAFGGSSVQKFQRNKDEVTVKVSYPKDQRQTQADILQAKIRTPQNTVLPMSAVAKIIPEYAQTDITRIDGLRAIYVTGIVDKEVIAANELVDHLKATVVSDLLKTYPDLTIYFGGEAEQQAETTNSMAQMFFVAMLAIYALLAIPLRSYIQPLLIMTAIPFGIVGAILGHWLNDLTISVLSLFGVIALSGVVINDSLLLVSTYNDLRKTGMGVTDAIIESCTSRLRAVLLTSITTFAGLAPLLSETSRQAQFLIPAAAALGYGILFATVITLLLTPSLLMIQEEIRRLLIALKTKLFTKQDSVERC